MSPRGAEGVGGGGISEIFCSQERRWGKSSEFLRGRDPDVVPGLVLNDLFDFVVNLLERVSLYDGWKRKEQACECRAAQGLCQLLEWDRRRGRAGLGHRHPQLLEGGPARGRLQHAGALGRWRARTRESSGSKISRAPGPGSTLPKEPAHRLPSSLRSRAHFAEPGDNVTPGEGGSRAGCEGPAPVRAAPAGPATTPWPPADAALSFPSIRAPVPEAGGLGTFGQSPVAPPAWPWVLNTCYRTRGERGWKGPPRGCSVLAAGPSPAPPAQHSPSSRLRLRRSQGWRLLPVARQPAPVTGLEL